MRSYEAFYGSTIVVHWAGFSACVDMWWAYWVPTFYADLGKARRVGTPSAPRTGQTTPSPVPLRVRRPQPPVRNPGLQFQKRNRRLPQPPQSKSDSGHDIVS